MGVELEIRCSKCGIGLNANLKASTDYRRDIFLEVEPCEDCLKEAKEEGDVEGYERGKDEAAAAAESNS